MEDTGFLLRKIKPVLCEDNEEVKEREWYSLVCRIRTSGFPRGDRELGVFIQCPVDCRAEVSLIRRIFL